MNIQENILLAPYTTFKIGGKARFFCEVGDQFDALQGFEFANAKSLQTLVLGGGSNLLISDDGFDGLVMHVKNKGTEILHQDESTILLKVAAGESWDGVVQFAVDNGWWGIENLSHIPGSSGAIAVQNVGAYGQEAKNLIESLTVFDRQTGQILSLKNADCNFAYRSSIFNTTYKGRYIIFYIIFKLQKDGQPDVSYRDLQTKFAGKQPSLKEIRQAVIEIRDKKFPFPTEAKKGNSGSFFKNPVLSAEQYSKLKEDIKNNFNLAVLESLDTKVFVDGENYKVPAAFLFEICELKSITNKGAAINPNQPLVIVNATGKATAEDVLLLAAEAIQKVYSKTNVKLSVEPELIGFSPSELEALEV